MLQLALLRCPDQVTPESRRSAGRDIVLGRGAECDWVLADPDRVLSKRHCSVEFRGGAWQLRDLSTNGTFVNKAEQPVGRDLVVPLSDGDRIAFGPYEFEVRIEAEPAAGLSSTAGRGMPSPNPVFDPFAPPPAAAGGTDPFPPANAARGGALPGDWNPFAEEPPQSPAFGNRNPAIADAFAPPPVRPLARLPDDWDLDQPPAPSPAPSPGRAPPPVAGGLPSDWDPLADLQPDAVQAAPPAPASMPPPETAPLVVAPVSAAPAPPASGATGASADVLLDAFLRGAGIGREAIPAGDPVAAMRRAGEAMAALVAGIRSLLIARADVKREFRIEQTMLRRANNNPLKFAATDEAALAALIGFEAGTRAVAATVDDLVSHQVASLAATQAAVRAMLAVLDPAAIEAEDQGGRMFATRERRCWEAYKRLHAETMARFDDDFDGIFGKEFARAYEAATKR